MVTNFLKFELFGFLGIKAEIGHNGQPEFLDRNFWNQNLFLKKKSSFWENLISSEISLFASKIWGYSVLWYHVIITVDRPVVILLLINPRVHPKITIFKLFLTIRLQTVKSNNEFRIGPDSVQIFL